MGIRRVTSSTFLISVVKALKRVLKSAYLASKLMSVPDKMSMLQSKLGGFMRIKTRLFKGLISVRGLNDPTHMQKTFSEKALRGSGGRVALLWLEE
eukprot:scaffold111941_cov15-Tisochrysis_lutea.AAC.1